MVHIPFIFVNLAIETAVVRSGSLHAHGYEEELWKIGNNLESIYDFVMEPEEPFEDLNFLNYSSTIAVCK